MNDKTRDTNPSQQDITRVSSGAKVMAYLMSFLLVWQPIAVSAAGVITAGNTQTQTKQAQNGVPIVNIAAPSSKGVSYNTYQQFNIDKKGLILNNSRGITATQLAGQIDANPHLQNGSSANLIVNEVTGHLRSNLNGYQEVAGRAADVILTNSNGITCNGCGFINTPRATLSTGTATLEQGGLTGLSVSQGDVTIEGLGLNASNINRFDIVTRTVKLNADLHAKELNVVLGRNDVNYATLEATKKAATVDAVEFALDSSALGGMYANSIKLVGTESGVGVKTLGNVATHAGQLSLSAEGKLSLNTVQSAGELKLTSQSDIVLNDNTNSQNKVTITGQKITNKGLLYSKGDSQITSEDFINEDHVISDKAIIINSGNVTNKDSIISEGELSLTARHTLDNQNSTIKSIGRGKSTINAGDKIDNTAGLIVSNANNLTLTSNEIINDKGSLSNTGQFDLASKTLSNDQGLIQSSKSLNVTIDSFDTDDGTFNAAEALAVTTKGDIVNSAGNQLLSDGSISLTTTGDITNHGTISSLKDLSLTSKDLTNSGQLNAAEDIEITAGNIINRGSIVAGNDNQITANTKLDNYHSILAVNDLTLHVQGAVKNHKNADIYASNDITIAQDEAFNKNSLIHNEGTIESYDGDIKLATQQLDNTTAAPTVTTTSKRVSGQFFRPTKQGYVAKGNTYGSIAEGSAYLDIHNPNEFTIFKTYASTSGWNTFWYRNSYKRINLATVNATTQTQHATLPTTTAKIIAGKNIQIDGDTINNQLSQIAANNNIVLTGTNLYNTALSLTEKVTGSWNLRTRKNESPNSSYKGVHTQGTIDATNVVANVSSTIYAGGSITGDFNDKVDNVNIKERTNKTPATERSTTQAQGNSISTDDKLALEGGTGRAYINEVVQNQTGETNQVGAPLLPPSGGLFTVFPQPNSRYLVETNSLFTQYNNFISSDYMLSQLGFDPNTAQKRLGDGFYETRVVRDAVFAQTGQRYAAGQTNDLDQFKTLMTQGVATAQQLDLDVGVSLTPQQVAQLTHDIVWLEAQQVAGQTVLVPVYYAAKLNTGDVNSAGALLTAQAISLETGDILNNGQIASAQDTRIDSAGTIENRGTVSSGGAINLAADSDIKVIGGKLKSEGKMALVSRNGDVQIGRTIKQAHFVTANASEDRAWIGNRSELTSGNTLSIDAGHDIAIKSSNITADNDITLTAANDVSISSERVENGAKGRYNYSNGTGQFEVRDSEHLGSRVETAGDFTVHAQNDIAVLGSTVQADKNIGLTAGNDIRIEAVEDNHFVEHQSKSKKRQSHSITETKINQKAGLTAGGDVQLGAGHDIAIKGGDITAKETISLAANNDISIESVKDASYSFYEKKSKKSFGRRSSKTEEAFSTHNIASELNAGNDVLINAEIDSIGNILATEESGNVTVIGSTLNAEGNVTVASDKNVSFESSADVASYYYKKTKSGFLGLSKSNKGKKTFKQLQAEAKSIGGGTTSIDAGGDIRILASQVISGDDINLKAVDEVLVAATETIDQIEQWDQKSSFFSGGDFFSSKEHADGNTTITSHSAQLNSSGTVNIDAGNAKVVGSTILGQEGINVTTDIGDIEIIAATGKENSFVHDKEINVSFGDLTGSLTGTDSPAKFEDGQFKVSLGKATYNDEEEKIESVKQQQSSLQSGGDIKLNSAENIVVIGSNINAEGNVNLKADSSIAITEAKETIASEYKQTTGEAEVSFVVKHQAIEVAKAIKDLAEAKAKLSEAKKSLKEYQRELKKVEATINKLTADYENKVPGVSYQHLIDLRDVYQDFKEDGAWYKAGVAAAALNVGQKTYLIAQQVTAAAESTSSWAFGFDAGIQLDIDALKTKTKTQSTQSIASNIQGQNIIIDAGNNEGDQALLQGSHLNAEDTIIIDAHDINIVASRDSSTQQTEEKHGHITAGISVFGTSSGATINASFDRSQNRDRTTVYQNSTVNADTINLTSTADTTISGATIRANEELNVTVGDDLLVESRQNIASGNSSSLGVSAGISFGGDGEAEQRDVKGSSASSAVHGLQEINKVSGVSGGANTSNGRYLSQETVVTSLTSGGTANIQVEDNTTLVGAVIATTDEQNNDLEQLTLTTNSFDFIDLTNTHTNSQTSAGASVRVGVKQVDKNKVEGGGLGGKLGLESSSFNQVNASTVDVASQLATLGKGNITIEDKASSTDLTRLNRDTKQIDKDIYQVNNNTNVDLLVDPEAIAGSADVVGEGAQITGNGIVKLTYIKSAKDKEGAEGNLYATLNFITSFIGGSIAEVPILLGQADRLAGTYQVFSKGSAELKGREDEFQPIEESEAYKDLSEARKNDLKGRELYVSINNVAIDKTTATYQNGTNGMLNTLGESLRNILLQTQTLKEGDQIAFTLNYNPSHGFVSDLLESAVDVAGWWKTGMAKQTGRFIRAVSTARGIDGSNFNNHSQGNILTKAGIEYIAGFGSYEQGGFKDEEYFLVLGDDGDITKNASPTFGGYGSAVNTDDMNEIVEGNNFIWAGAFTHRNDFVGEGIGRNAGVNAQSGGLLVSLPDLWKLFTAKSPHSTYYCGEGEGSEIRCGVK